MSRKKELGKEYKERKIVGGVYRVTNTQNGKFLLDHVANLKSAQNRFQFAVNLSGGFDYKLKKDWDEFGAAAFQFEVLEELEQHADQTEIQFKEDLKTLEQLWRSNLDSSKEYR
jgi:hypothetical protein